MTHPVYSARILSAKGLVHLRKIAKEFGVTPKDGRTIQSHVDAIVKYQASKFQKAQVKLLPSAVIGFESESFESLTQPYMVIFKGQVVERFATYAQAERHCLGKYNIAIERPSHEALCQIGNDHLHPVQSFEEYLEDLVFDSSKTEEVVDDYLFHDEIKMERGSSRDKGPCLVAV